MTIKWMLACLSRICPIGNPSVVVTNVIIPGMNSINWSQKNTLNYSTFKVIHLIVHWENLSNNSPSSAKHKIVNVSYTSLPLAISIAIPPLSLPSVSCSLAQKYKWSSWMSHLVLDACHMLTCAIMLLNTDLHDSVSQSSGRRLRRTQSYLSSRIENNRKNDLPTVQRESRRIERWSGFF